MLRTLFCLKEHTTWAYIFRALWSINFADLESKPVSDPCFIFDLYSLTLEGTLTSTTCTERVVYIRLVPTRLSALASGDMLDTLETSTVGRPILKVYQHPPI